MKVQRADPKTRKTALFVVSIAVGLALLAYITLDQQLTAQQLGVLLARPGLIVGICILLSLPIIASSIYLFALGTRMVTERRSPVRGQRLVKDMLIHEGKPAVIRGRVAQLLATVLLFGSAAIPVLLWLILRSIASDVT